MDEIFQGDDVLYKKFAKELYLNRLKKYYLNDLTAEQIEKQFSAKLEKYSEDKIINELQKRYQNKEYRHFKDLRTEIREGITSKLLNEVDNLDLKLEYFISDTDNNPLEQKYKIYLLYKEWANWGTKKSKVFSKVNKLTVDIEAIMDFVNQQYAIYKKEKKGETEFTNIEEKYKADFFSSVSI